MKLICLFKYLGHLCVPTHVVAHSSANLIGLLSDNFPSSVKSRMEATRGPTLAHVFDQSKFMIADKV